MVTKIYNLSKIKEIVGEKNHLLLQKITHCEEETIATLWQILLFML
jgi:hypothetical protein